MNTDHVKNIVIGLFASLIVLFSLLIFAEERQYTLASIQIEHIATVLNRGDITLSAPIPTHFGPRAQIQMQHYHFDMYALAHRFFGGAPFGIEYDDLPRIFYYCDVTGKELMHNMNDNTMQFSAPYGLLLGVHHFVPTASAAEMLALTFIEEILGEPATNVVLLTNDLIAGGNYMLTFFERYNDYILYNNQIRIKITSRGVELVQFSYMAVSGFIGDERPIFPADAALLALLAHLRGAGEIEHPVEIIDIQLVYFFIERGTPAYLFTVIVLGYQFDYLFNAYTNTLIWLSRR